MAAEEKTDGLLLFAADDLAPGEIRSVDVAGVAVVVVRTPEGDVYALRDLCPHLGAKLSPGYMERAVTSDKPGEYQLADEYVLRCPWHGHEFAVETGRCLVDPAGIRVRSYKVTTEDGQLYLHGIRRARGRQ